MRHLCFFYHHHCPSALTKNSTSLFIFSLFSSLHSTPLYLLPSPPPTHRKEKGERDWNDEGRVQMARLVWLGKRQKDIVILHGTEREKWVIEREREREREKCFVLYAQQPRPDFKKISRTHFPEFTSTMMNARKFTKNRATVSEDLFQGKKARDFEARKI